MLATSDTARVSRGNEALFRFKDDPPHTQLKGRHIAAQLLKNKLHNPYRYDLQTYEKDEKRARTSANNDIECLHSSTRVLRREKPSLMKAWAYFEHVTTPRYIVSGDDKKT